jgi:hypothetical protein
MNVRRFLAFALVFPLSPVSYAQSLDEIQKFAKDICDEIRPEGSIARKEVEAKLKGQLAGVAKLIGASVTGDGKLKVENVDYKGLPYEDLAAQMANARDCRLQLAKMLIEEKKRIAAQKPVSYKTCRHPDFGQVGWQRSENYTNSSGWVGGGHDQTWWCNQVANSFIQARSIGPKSWSRFFEHGLR